MPLAGDVTVQGGFRVVVAQLSPPPVVEPYLGTFVQLGVFVLVFVVVFAVGIFVVAPRARAFMARRNLEPTLQEGIERFGGIVLVVLALAVAAIVTGYAQVLAASAVVLAALTVTIGVAAREVTSNLVSGLAIIADRSINYGDWVRVDDTEGVIVDIGYRAMRIRTFDNELVVVPNATVVSSTLTNIAIHDVLRLSYLVAVGYDEDLETARQLLCEAAEGHDEILEIPEPTVVIEQFGDAGVEFGVRFWIASPARSDALRVRSEFAQRVVERFAAEDVELQPASTHELSGEVTVATDAAWPDERA